MALFAFCRVIVLILALLIVIPLLLAEEDDLTLEDASKMLHQMNILCVYDPATYSVILYYICTIVFLES